MGMTDAIVVRDLRKSFGSVAAVVGLSFQVAAGEVFGFLGPNGAGKSTTINLLMGLAGPMPRDFAALRRWRSSNSVGPSSSVRG